MAELKRQTFFFSNGKQIRLYGTGFGITKSLEISEAGAPNVFYFLEGKGNGKSSVSNLHELSAEELHELAEYNIRLWLEFKDNIRKYGIDNPRLFNLENKRADDDTKPELSSKKGNNAPGEPKEKNNGKAKVPVIKVSNPKRMQIMIELVFKTVMYETVFV
jgi:hypothetical protein